MYKRLLIVAALVASASSIASISNASAAHEDNTNENKITICHRTNAPKNPYRLITVNKSATDGDGKNDHTHHKGPAATSFVEATALKDEGKKWGDIIPDFTWKGVSHQGLNWSAEGQAVYNNHCNYPAPVVPTSIIDYVVICDVVNQRAKITLTNTGSASGFATVNGTVVTIAADDKEIAYVPTPDGKVQIVIVIADVVVYNDNLDCRTGGQGTVDEPGTETPTTPTTPDTTATPAAGQGATPIATASETEVIASLPYTAGNSAQMIAIIVSALAALIAVASTIVKKAYLKQI